MRTYPSRPLLLLPTLLLLALLPGCGAVGFGGAMIESYRRQSTKAVEREYAGLTGKNFAVVVCADRSIQGEYPDMVVWLTSKLTERLVEHQDVVGKDSAIAAHTAAPRRPGQPAANSAR